MPDHPSYRPDAPKLLAHDPLPTNPPLPGGCEACGQPRGTDPDFCDACLVIMRAMRGESTAHDVARYLNARERTTATPIDVTIARMTYVGARFITMRDHHPGTRAYDEAMRGERPMTFEHAGLYLIGELPASYLNRHAAGYRADDGQVYYVSGWWHPDNFVSVAHVREDDGSTRPMTIDDVRAYHYADARVPHFQMMPGTPTDRYGVDVVGSRIKPMIVREVTS